jgi:TolA-binding protein
MAAKARSGWYYLVAVVLLLVVSINPAFAVNRNVIEAQVQVRAISDQAMILQQSIDQSLASATQALEQNAERLTEISEKLSRLRQVAQAHRKTSSLQTLTGQLTALSQSASELGARSQKIEHQVQVLASEIGMPAQAVVATGQAPRPDILLRNGMEDYDAGRYKLASQEFAQYMKFYSGNGQAGQAEFYLADSEYWAGNYKSALSDFDRLQQQFPGTEPATVELKQGLCLVKLGDSGAAKAAFQRIIDRYPNSVEAMDARSALGSSLAVGVS